MWGTLPIGVSVLAMFLVILLPSRQRVRKVVEPVTLQERERHYVA
jgi:hypothetical protein